MRKELQAFDIWMGNERDCPNRKFIRVSRWIKIQTNYNPNKRNALWDYVMDARGYHAYQDKFDASEGLFLDYFRFNGTTYALDQFIRIGGIADSIGHSEGYIEDKQKHFLCGYDGNDYFHPLYIELDEWGEYVRLYVCEEGR